MSLSELGQEVRLRWCRYHEGQLPFISFRLGYYCWVLARYSLPTITILLERWIQSYMEVHTVFMWATEHETY
jgi:hypothetical protein